MQLGGLELLTVSGGTYWIDGGSMFGVVPRVLWEKDFPVDDQHRIPQRTNCVLIRGDGRTTLIDTGYGSRLSDRQRRNLSAEDGEPLVNSLAEHGIGTGDVDLVVLSHLHFDHAGGATRQDEHGRIVPAFPNAEFVVQRHEWVIATAGYPELRAAYFPESLLPLRESGQLRLIDGDVEIAPGLHAIVTGGHTEGHMALRIESGGQAAVYLADLCATWRHLPVLWCLGYDTHLLQTRRAKAALLGRLADTGTLALFDHDPDIAAARIIRDARRDFAVTESFARL